MAVLATHGDNGGGWLAVKTRAAVPVADGDAGYGD